jgi:cell division protein FtsL
MGQRGSRRRARATILAVAYALSVVVLVGVGIFVFATDPRVLRGLAVAAALGGVVTMLMVRHQLLVERAAHGEQRAKLAQEYSRLTNLRVVENAEVIETLHRRLDEIESEVASVVTVGDRHSAAEAPTVISLAVRAEAG